jgi:DegV family protein with EDD domain
MNYKIVSDSASNIFHLPDVSYQNVPLKIITSEAEYADSPFLDIPNMIQELKSYTGTSSTSCPNVHEWLEAYEGSDAIFAISITSTLSGSYSSAMQAAMDYENEHPGAHVCVIDSLSAGPEMQLIIEKLQELILAEKSFEEIKELILTYQKHTHLLFSLQSLHNLSRNGRVHPAVAKMAGLLGIRLVGKASAEGTLEPLHKCRNEKRALKTILKEMKNTGYCGGKVRIAHCMNEKASLALKKLVEEEFPDSDVTIGDCKGLCSYYAENGGLMIGFTD